jgi:hypothetical protein
MATVPGKSAPCTINLIPGRNTRHFVCREEDVRFHRAQVFNNFRSGGFVDLT